MYDMLAKANSREKRQTNGGLGWEREESQRLEGLRGLFLVEGMFLLCLKRDGGYLTACIC